MSSRPRPPFRAGPSHVVVCLVCLLAIVGQGPGAWAEGGGAVPAGAARAVIDMGKVAIQPSGAQRSIEVTGSFALYEGDALQPLPGAQVRAVAVSGASATLEVGTTYLVSGGHIVRASNGSKILALSAPAGSATTAAATAYAAPQASGPSLAGAVTPIDGEVHLKEPGWTGWVRVPHRTSCSWGAEVEAAPHAKAEVALSDSLLIRLIGPASLIIYPRHLEVRGGDVLFQAGGDQRSVTVRTPVARIHLTGTLMEVSHGGPTQETRVRVHAGVVQMASRAENKGPAWSRYVSANREAVVRTSGRPEKALRFDKRQSLARFIEGWKPEGPGDSFLPPLTEDTLLRQLRADQAPSKRPPAAKADRSPRSISAKATWVRLRMESMESPANRRHFMAFKRYMRARERRERAEQNVPPSVASAMEKDEVARDQIPGGPTRKFSKAKLRMLRWHERRMGERLHGVEKDMAYQDIEAAHDSRSVLDNRKRETRERLYGQDLRLQTRRLITTTRLGLDARATRIADINSQIITLSGIPGNDALIRTLRAERDGLLREADRLKDTLEELIELH